MNDFQKILFSLCLISCLGCKQNVPTTAEMPHQEAEITLPPIQEDSSRYTPPKEMSVNNLKDSSLLQKNDTRTPRQIPLRDSKNPLSGNYTDAQDKANTRVWFRDGASDKELAFEYEIENSQIGCGNSLSGKAIFVSKNQFKATIPDLEGCQILFTFDKNNLKISSEGCNQYLGEPCGVGGDLKKQKK